jgi:hypothetical protein
VPKKRASRKSAARPARPGSPRAQGPAGTGPATGEGAAGGSGRRFGTAMLEAVDNQVRDGDPPETAQTLDRLVAAGYSRAEARRLVAVVLTAEFWRVMTYREPFDLARYVAALHRLPDVQDDPGDEPGDQPGNQA